MADVTDWQQRDEYYRAGPGGWTICRVFAQNRWQYEVWAANGTRHGMEPVPGCRDHALRRGQADGIGGTGSMESGNWYFELPTSWRTGCQVNAVSGRPCSNNASAWAAGNSGSIQWVARPGGSATGRRSWTSIMPPAASLVTMAKPWASSFSASGRQLLRPAKKRGALSGAWM